MNSQTFTIGTFNKAISKSESREKVRAIVCLRGCIRYWEICQEIQPLGVYKQMHHSRVSTVQSPQGQKGEQFFPIEIGLVNTTKLTGFVVSRDLSFQKEKMFMHYLRGFSFLYRVSLLVQVRVQCTCTHCNCRNRSHAICWIHIVVKFLSQNCMRASILPFTPILLRSLHFLVCFGPSSIDSTCRPWIIVEMAQESTDTS